MLGRLLGRLLDWLDRLFCRFAYNTHLVLLLYRIACTRSQLFTGFAFFAFACHILFEGCESTLALLHSRLGGTLQEVDKVKVDDNTRNYPARQQYKDYAHDADLRFEHIDNGNAEFSSPATAEESVSSRSQRKGQ